MHIRAASLVLGMVISYLLSFGYRGIIWHVKDLRLLNSSRLFAWRAGLSCCTCTSALHAMTGMHQPLTIAIPAPALQPCCASSQMLSLRCNCFIRLLPTLSTPAGTFFRVCFLLFFVAVQPSHLPTHNGVPHTHGAETVSGDCCF